VKKLKSHCPFCIDVSIFNQRDSKGGEALVQLFGQHTVVKAKSSLLPPPMLKKALSHLTRQPDLHPSSRQHWQQLINAATHPRKRACSIGIDYSNTPFCLLTGTNPYRI